MKEALLYYNTSQQHYAENASIVVDQLCNGYTVINIGTTVMAVNKIALNPGTAGTNNGESVSVGGNRGEIFAGRIDIAFTGGTGLCIVLQKIYVKSGHKPKTFDLLA